jgi:omega-6 fatty acid desaturase (delta-12 desaturase)
MSKIGQPKARGTTTITGWSSVRRRALLPVEKPNLAVSKATHNLVPESRPLEKKPPWVAALKRFETTDPRRATAQLLNTLVPYLGMLVLMELTMAWHLPYVVTALLAIPAGALMVRTFIIFHDCGHGTFVASPVGRQILGNALGVLTFTAFSDWRRSHGIHHSTAGNLDRRGIGDIWTMTLEEYEASTPLRRLRYRLFRNPFIMFGLGPLYSFLLLHRVPTRGSNRNQVLSVMLTNAAVAGIVIAAAFTIGIKAYLLIQLPVLIVGGAGGVWLFYIQHQFDPSYWARTEEWESMASAMQGSSYYRLPKVLQWISGNIGLHHIHHLRPRIPNYNLQDCLDQTPELQLPDPLLLWPSLKSIRLKVWDERTKRLLTFPQVFHHLRRTSLA